MEDFENDIIAVLEQVNAAEMDGHVPEELYNQMIDTFADAAVENGVDRMEFYEKATSLMPFIPSDQLNDDNAENDGGRIRSYLAIIDSIAVIARLTTEFVRRILEHFGL
jgi:hypothetical protein